MILRDFHCEACNDSFEDYLASSVDRVAPCPKCGAECEAVLSVPHVGAFAMMSPGQKSDVLRKRSHNHTMSELKKEPEKHGFVADDKRRWNIRSHSKPSS